MGFLEDVVEGLSADKKFLPSRYFYDAEGDRIFQAIMKLPEYYLTNSEFEIFSTQAANILKAFAIDGKPFDLVEFGAGDGFKTKVLIQRLLEAGADFDYIPIDISGDVLDTLKYNLAEVFPDLEVRPYNDEYFQALEKISINSKRPKVVLFLGSSIGNFLQDRTILFLKALNEKLNTGDKTLIGFDLKKNPKIILAAYNDAQGITKAFNINLLERINRELGGDFELEAFDHYPYYDPDTGLAKSYLVSLKVQDVHIKAAGKTFSFANGETIHTEISRKYSLSRIASLFEETGFKVTEHFFDCRHYYVNTLAEKK